MIIIIIIIIGRFLVRCLLRARTNHTEKKFVITLKYFILNKVLMRMCVGETRENHRKLQKHELRDHWVNTKCRVKYTFSLQKEKSGEKFLVGLWSDSTPPPPQWARASSFTRFLDHTQ